MHPGSAPGTGQDEGGSPRVGRGHHDGPPEEYARDRNHCGKRVRYLWGDLKYPCETLLWGGQRGNPTGRRGKGREVDCEQSLLLPASLADLQPVGACRPRRVFLVSGSWADHLHRSKDRRVCLSPSPTLISPRRLPPHRRPCRPACDSSGRSSATASVQVCERSTRQRTASSF